MPVSVLRKLARPFLGPASALQGSFPKLTLDLEQSNIGIKKKEYISIMLFLWAFYFGAVFVLAALLLQRISPNYLLTSFALGFFLSAMVMLQLVYYPKMLIKKKEREIEKNLVFALRAMLIQIRSGISLYYAMKIIAEGNYGQLGVEFKKMIKYIDAGVIQEDAMAKMAQENPSTIFRRVIRQIVNGLKGGGDVEKIIGESLKSLSRRQRIGVERYGTQLRILSLIYMMIGIIIPALGLVFLIVLGSFPKITIQEWYFWGLLGGIVLVEFLFIGMMKSQRPTLLGD